MVAEKFVKEKYEEQQHQNKRFTLQDNVLVGNPILDEFLTDGISKVLLDAFDKSPDFVAQINVDTGEKITFAQMKDSTVRCALWLQKQGISRNDIVCISTPSQTDDYVPLLATFYIGAICNPWYHELTPAISRYFFETIKPKIVFTCEQSIDVLAQAAKDTNVKCQFVIYGPHRKYASLRDIMAEQSQYEVDNFHYVEIEEPRNEPCIIYFSSGTTGTQKGAVLSHYTLLNNRARKYWNLREKINVLWYTSLSWITGLTALVSCTQLCATRIIHSDSNPETIGEVMEKYKVNWVMLSPSMVTQMCKTKTFSKYDFSSLECLMTSGSRIAKTTLEEIQRFLPHVKMCNAYGMTEAGGLLSINAMDGKKIDSVGFIVDGIKMKVINPVTGQILGPNKPGEICFSLCTMMLGYYKNPTETKKMIDTEGWLHTGDQGYFDEDGEITLTDRLKEVIIMQNHHISPSQIEDILLRHPQIKEAAVVPVPHPVDIERPFAFVVKVPGATITEEEIKDFPSSFNEYFRLTGGVVFVDQLEYTPTQKKSTKKMKEIAKTYVH